MLLPGESRRVPVVVLACVVLLVAIAGCGGGGVGADSEAQRPRTVERPSPNRHRDKGVAARAVPSRCPAGLPSCRTTEGRVIYVERVDPDGDGDAHFVVIDSRSITLPGLTAIDVRRGLRPRPLPAIGDLISAAGPVQTGSYGQHQIHALELHVAGR